MLQSSLATPAGDTSITAHHGKMLAPTSATPRHAFKPALAEGLEPGDVTDGCTRGGHREHICRASALVARGDVAGVGAALIN